MTRKSSPPIPESQDTREAFRVLNDEYRPGLLTRWVRLFGADLRAEIMKEVEAKYGKR